MYIYIHIYTYIYINLPVNIIVRLPHPRSRDHPLLKSKPATMTQNAQTTNSPYQP